ncbi:Hypothetical_protein [Hexamita inflata]|uniref:Hypothetical_protein n=1 Tax=Hexamita inflata TaxID=28002 RepID=A0AA86U0L0_9EUKA|nr:Hypothetical protein HINF_LOCUS24840 [Hexamita inflata]
MSITEADMKAKNKTLALFYVSKANVLRGSDHSTYDHSAFKYSLLKLNDIKCVSSLYTADSRRQYSPPNSLNDLSQNHLMSFEILGTISERFRSKIVHQPKTERHQLR